MKIRPFFVINIPFLHVSGMAIFPFVFVKNTRKSKVLLNHERIHITQQLEMLVLPFFIWYIIEYCIGYYKFKNHDWAYRSISFEKEAYKHDNDFDYLKKRPFWAFTKYLKK